MKFPYGISDFKKIIIHDYLYHDRTGRIPLLEASESQLFIRPRRFGKSLLLSMLENYYDVDKKDEFQTLFGHLKIGKNSTPLRNSYYILKMDFSCVDPTGTADDVKGALFDHINDSIKRFILNYRNYDLPEIEINKHNAISSMSSLLSATSTTPYPVFLLIDEYDNFANTVMMWVQRPITAQEGIREERRYQSLVHEQGPLRTFFKAVKASTSGNMFDRVFITGLSPVVMSDITEIWLPCAGLWKISICVYLITGITGGQMNSRSKQLSLHSFTMIFFISWIRNPTLTVIMGICP